MGIPNFKKFVAVPEPKLSQVILASCMSTSSARSESYAPLPGIIPNRGKSHVQVWYGSDNGTFLPAIERTALFKPLPLGSLSRSSLLTVGKNQLL